jgi:hypothetical protein
MSRQFALLRLSLKRARTEPNQKYYIVNVQTGDFVSLLSNGDRWDIVSTNEASRVSEVSRLTVPESHTHYN